MGIPAGSHPGSSLVKPLPCVRAGIAEGCDGDW